MRFQQNPRLKRLLKPFGQIEVRHCCDGVRIHQDIWDILYHGESKFRSRHPGSGVTAADFIRSGLVEFERRQFIHRVEARVYLPPFVRPELLKYARAQHGTPIWLPSLVLDKLGNDVWRKALPSWKNGKIVW
jgi:hypothetical protein